MDVGTFIILLIIIICGFELIYKFVDLYTFKRKQQLINKIDKIKSQENNKHHNNIDPDFKDVI